jgi:GNAT superfamily N-acetyltransferase
MAVSDPALETESPLTVAELDDAGTLVREAGWNQVSADWRTFLDLGTVHAVHTGEGRLVATAATLPYGGRFAWIGMVLVAGDYRRRGLATRLLRRCMDDLISAQLVPVLDATPNGRAVYRPLGFEDTWGFHRLESPGRISAMDVPSAPEGITIAPIADSVWPAVLAYDAAAFGADRSALLARLRGRLPAAGHVAERGGRVMGFALGRDGRRTSQIGPLIAEDDATARALLARALMVQGPIYIDLADAKAEIRAWLEAQGFAPQRPFTRMVYGTRTGFDDPTRTFAVVGPEFG